MIFHPYIFFCFLGSYFEGTGDEVTEKCISEGSIMNNNLNALDVCCACQGKVKIKIDFFFFIFKYSFVFKVVLMVQINAVKKHAKVHIFLIDILTCFYLKNRTDFTKMKKC